MAADVAAPTADRRRRRRRPRAAFAARGVLAPRSARTAARSSASSSSCCIVLVALFAPTASRRIRPIEQFRDAVRAPPVWDDGGTWRFLLGTDGVGRDMLSRLIYGARVSLFIGLSVMACRFVVGVVARACSPAIAAAVVDVAIMRAHGPDPGGAEPGARRAGRRHARAQPRQHHRRRHDRLSCRATCAWRARPRSAELSKDYVTAARVAGVGPLRLMLIDRAAELPRAADRAGGARLLRAPSSRRRRSASSASAPSRRRRNGARCWPMRANSSSSDPVDRHPARASPS